MQKVLQVLAPGTDRTRETLAAAIEATVAEFVSSVGGKLKEFVIAMAEMNQQGFGHALVVVNYEPGEPEPLKNKKGGK